MNVIEECTKYIICDRCNIKIKSRCSMGSPEAIRLRQEIKKIETSNRVIFNTACNKLSNSDREIIQQWEQKIDELLTYLPVKIIEDKTSFHLFREIG